MKKLLIMVITVVTVAGLTAGCGLIGGKDIGREAALQAALDDAGVEESDTTRLKVSEDHDDGRKVYEIQFDADGTEYDYEIQASDGAVLSVETESLSAADGTGNVGATTTENNSQSSQKDVQNENQNNGGNQETNVAVSRDEAVQIALGRVDGATEQDIRIELDWDDGKCKYEGEIIYNNVEYEFEIDANSGTILGWSEEKF